jgi:hypothetical protein
LHTATLGFIRQVETCDHHGGERTPQRCFTIRENFLYDDCFISLMACRGNCQHAAVPHRVLSRPGNTNPKRRARSRTDAIHHPVIFLLARLTGFNRAHVHLLMLNIHMRDEALHHPDGGSDIGFLETERLAGSQLLLRKRLMISLASCQTEPAGIARQSAPNESHREPSGRLEPPP